VTNSNWHPISYRLGVIAAYCSNFGHFAFLRGGLRDNVRCSSWAHCKARSRIERFSLGVTAESLRGKRERKSTISLECGQFDAKFQVEGVARIVRPVNALQFVANSFHTEKFRSRLSSSEVRF